MADDNKRPANAEGQPIEEKQGQRVEISTTIDGTPVFGSVLIDPDTGDLLHYDLTDEMGERLQQSAQEAAKTALNMLGGTNAAFNKTMDALRKMIHDSTGAKVSESIRLYNENIKKSVHSVLNNFLTEDTRKLLRDIADDLQAVQTALNELETLRTYINEELQKPEYNGATLEDLLQDYTPIELTDLPTDSVLYKVLEAARAAQAADRETQIDVYKADKLDLPTDKLNLFAWDLRATDGQLKFDLSRAGTDDTATALFSLSFDDDPNIKLTKEVDHFDKRVMSACGTAFASGYPIISATGIYYAMGNTGRPSQKHLDKINDTLTKLDMAKVFVDNTIEAGTYNYPKFRKEDRLLHFKRVSRIVNGKTTDAVIQILEEPVLMTFARQRKQISAIPIKVLQTPARRTNNYYQIEDYLLWRIAQQKNKVGKLREQQQKKYTQNRERELKEAAKLTILLATFYERTGNAKKDATGKKRARKTAEECLIHYKSEAGGCWITDYKIESDRILITLPTR